MHLQIITLFIQLQLFHENINLRTLQSINLLIIHKNYFYKNIIVYIVKNHVDETGPVELVVPSSKIVACLTV